MHYKWWLRLCTERNSDTYLASLKSILTPVSYVGKANEFPSSFESIVRKILRLLYHVVAHIYHCHFREVALLGLHAHLNCVFAHLTLLNQRFNLIDPKETEILGDLEAALLGKIFCILKLSLKTISDIEGNWHFDDSDYNLNFRQWSLINCMARYRYEISYIRVKKTKYRSYSIP